MFFLQDAAAAAAGTGSLLVSMLPILLIFVIFYFFIIRPQNKKQKETDKMIAALKKGDKIVTIGGIHGTVAQTKEVELSRLFSFKSRTLYFLYFELFYFSSFIFCDSIF